MPQTKPRTAAAKPAAKSATTRKPAARKPAARKPAAAKRATARKPAAAGKVERTTVLSEDVLKSLESGERAAIEAVRKFVERIDKVLPDEERSKRRQEIIDSAMEMADRLVKTQYEFLRKVVDSAGKALSENGRK